MSRRIIIYVYVRQKYIYLHVWLDKMIEYMQHMR